MGGPVTEKNGASSTTVGNFAMISMERPLQLSHTCTIESASSSLRLVGGEVAAGGLGTVLSAAAWESRCEASLSVGGRGQFGLLIEEVFS